MARQSCVGFGVARFLSWKLVKKNSVLLCVTLNFVGSLVVLLCVSSGVALATLDGLEFLNPRVICVFSGIRSPTGIFC